MSDKQPEALRLADELENGDCFESQPQVVYGWVTEDPTGDAAAELRHLHALCEEMGEALSSLVREHDAVFAGRNDGAQDSYYNAHPGRAVAYQKARAALAKWRESK